MDKALAVMNPFTLVNELNKLKKNKEEEKNKEKYNTVRGVDITAGSGVDINPNIDQSAFLGVSIGVLVAIIAVSFILFIWSLYAVFKYKDYIKTEVFVISLILIFFVPGGVLFALGLVYGLKSPTPLVK